jgi:hypothetical protein
VVRCTGACLGLAHGYRPRLVLTLAVPRVLAPNDRRWPARVRGGAGPLGWHLPVVRGIRDPPAASWGVGPAARGGGESGCLWHARSGKRGAVKGGHRWGRCPFKGPQWGGSGGGVWAMRAPHCAGRTWGLAPTGRQRTRAVPRCDAVWTGEHRPLMHGPRSAVGGRGRGEVCGLAREKKGCAKPGWTGNVSIYSIKFQLIRIVLIKRCTYQLQKFQIKYGWKEFEIRNNVAYRNCFRFETKFELKFREISMSWISIEIHWKFLELWNLMKFG